MRISDWSSDVCSSDLADGAWTSTLGWTDRSDGVEVGFGDCGERRITFEGHGGKQVAFDVTDSTFEGQGVTLRGRLLLPKGAGSVPLAVEVHGSERDSAIDYNYMQYLLPAQGEIGRTSCRARDGS